MISNPQIVTKENDTRTPQPVFPLNIHGLFSQNSSLITSTCSINTFALPLFFLSFSRCVLLTNPVSAVPAAQPPDSVTCAASFLGLVELVNVDVRDFEDLVRSGIVGALIVDADAVVVADGDCSGVVGGMGNLAILGEGRNCVSTDGRGSACRSSIWNG